VCQLSFLCIDSDALTIKFKFVPPFLGRYSLIRWLFLMSDNVQGMVGIIKFNFVTSKIGSHARYL